MRTLRPRLASYKTLASKRTLSNKNSSILRSVLRYPARHPESTPSPPRTPHVQRKKGGQLSPTSKDKEDGQGEAMTPPPQLVGTSTKRSPTPRRRASLERRRLFQRKRFFSRVSAKKHNRKRFLVYAGLLYLYYYLRTDTISTEGPGTPLPEKIVPSTLRMWSRFQNPSSTYLSFRRAKMNNVQEKEDKQMISTKRRNADDAIVKRKKRKMLESFSSWQTKLTTASSNMWNTYGGSDIKLLEMAEPKKTPVSMADDSSTKAATNLRGTFLSWGSQTEGEQVSVS